MKALLLKSSVMVAALAAVLIFSGCTGLVGGAVVATGVTGVSEVAASNALQKKAITLPQLSQLSTDLAALPGTPLPPQDNAIIANLITELTSQKQANLTQESVVDAVNNAINSLNLATAASPSAAQGVAWAYLQDVVGGFKAAVKNATANPSLVPTS